MSLPGGPKTVWGFYGPSLVIEEAAYVWDEMGGSVKADARRQRCRRPGNAGISLTPAWAVLGNGSLSLQKTARVSHRNFWRRSR